MRKKRDFAARMLTKTEMKQISGGFEESPLCPDGQLLYACKFLLDNKPTGDVHYVCATSRRSANITATDTVMEIGGARYDCE